MDGKYLDKKFLKYLLCRLGGSEFESEKFEPIFARYDKAKKYAGLELKEISVNEKGVLNIGEEIDENNGEWGIKQGKFYHYVDNGIKMTSIKFSQFKTIDDTIMGEAVIQFEVGDKDIIIDGLNALGWKWYQNGSNINNPVFKRNSLYMIHITTDHKVCFAELNTFEELSTPKERCVEIIYANSSNTVELFNLNWYKNYNGLIRNIYFAADGENYSLIDRSLFDNNNKLNCSSINPKLLIEFIEAKEQDDESNCNINFTNMLHDINFDQFYVRKLDANRIKSMKGMFSASYTTSTAKFTSIDLTGILNPAGFFVKGAEDTMFVDMFKNRRMNSDTSGENLKLFDNGCGINTSKATNLARMFMNGPLQPAHCDQNKENNIINGLRFDNCWNYTEMFRGLQCNNIIFNNALGSPNKDGEYNFTGMFSNSSIDNSAISNISNFIKGIDEKCKPCTTLKLNSIFEGCNNITDASDFSFSEIFDNKRALIEVDLTKMFSGCALLTNVPVLSLSHETHKNVTKLDLTSMFMDACKSTANINFGNFKNWILNFTTPFENGVAEPTSIIIMDSMFENCPLYKIQNGSGSVLEFCDKKSKHISGHPNCSKMFAGTADPNGYKSYNIKFNIWAGLYWDHSIDNPDSSDAKLDADRWFEGLNGMLDDRENNNKELLNKGFITIYNYNGLDEIGAPYNSILYYGLYNYIYKDSNIRTNIRLE